MEKEKVIERVKQLEKEAEDVKKTYIPDPFPSDDFVSCCESVDEGAFAKWKASSKSLILKIVEDKQSPYYEDFVQKVKRPCISYVNCGIGILRGLREELESEEIIEKTSTNKKEDCFKKGTKVNRWWKYTHPVWWVCSVFIFIEKHPLLSAIIGGLGAGFFIYIFKWK